MKTLLLKNARAICPLQGIDRVMNIFVADGKIAELDSTRQSAGEVIDCEGKTACPGFVDMHVHLRDPGQTHKEDIFSGCRAAAAGGVTSLLAMPNTSPTVDAPETVSYILEKAASASARVYVAASITKGLRGEELTDIARLKAAGAVALTDDGRPVENTELMAKALIRAQKEGMAVVSHCEDLFLAGNGKMNEGTVSKKLGVKGIPAAAENCASAREAALAESYGAKVHICHVSTAVSAAIIRSARQRGAAVTAETAPHYIALTENSLISRNANFRMNPPIRTEHDRLAIIDALCDGTIGVIATDHAPHTPEEKADFLSAPNGSIGMETSFAVCNTVLVKGGRMTLSGLIEKMSLNPARILGIEAGTLEVGRNADIAVLDPDKVWTVNSGELHGKSRNTPFDGQTLIGKTVCTILGGKVVFKEKEF